MEEFYSLQGEGYHTGQAASFLRIGGCDVGCHWCDIKESWDASKYPPVDIHPVIDRIARRPSKAMVVTGGEPLKYNLDHLCREANARGIRTFLETSGSSPLTGTWNWICLSPKKDAPPLAEIFPLAHELKVIIETQEDIGWAVQNASRVNKECKLYLQPEWSAREQVLPLIVEYIEVFPKWKISLQSHKYIGIP